MMEHKTCVFEQFESPCSIMTGDIINRIIANRFVFDGLCLASFFLFAPFIDGV